MSKVVPADYVRPAFLAAKDEVWVSCYKPSAYHLYEDCSALQRGGLAWGYDSARVHDAEFAISMVSFGAKRRTPKCCTSCLKRHEKDPT